MLCLVFEENVTQILKKVNKETPVVNMVTKIKCCILLIVVLFKCEYIAKQKLFCTSTKQRSGQYSFLSSLLYKIMLTLKFVFP